MLRRLGAGPYSEDSMIDISTLDRVAREGEKSLDGLLRGVDTALFGLPKIFLEESVAFYLCQGQTVTVPKAPTKGLLRIYSTAKQFIGLGEVLEDGRIAPRRLIKMQQCLQTVKKLV